ncbi:MAG: hypothetical protein AAF561_07370 [Planctomycetota bacterium]
MPARTDYLPNRIADLIEWCVSFVANIAPEPSDYGVDPTAFTAYQGILTDTQTLVGMASNPHTRTGPVVEEQQEKLRELRTATRALVRQIQARPETTDFQRRTLGITVPDRTRTERPAPTEEPVVTISECQRHMVAIKIRREDGRAGKPAGINGMNVYYAVSPTVPTHIGGWTHAGQATRMNHTIAMPLDVPAGATIWVTANYYNGRGEVGPLAAAATTNLPGGQVRLAA